jgi:pimeloyl-ACP methyl ester carboxylesterase
VDAYRREWPGRPVVLVGHSGGGAIAVFAAEAVNGAPLTGIVALAPALGPGYDLSAALSRTRMGIVNFHAANDYFLKTIIHVGFNFDDDRRRTAGADGFTIPRDLTPAARDLYDDRLKQIAWKPSMLKQGNWGGHFGWTGSLWIAHNLAPLLKSWAHDPAAEPPSISQAREHTLQ